MSVKYIAGMVVTAFLLTGCTATTPSSQPESTTSPAEGVMKADQPKSAEEKVGDTTLKGMISKVGENYFITVAGQTPKEIDSYAIKLDTYVGQTVTVTGQYSGDTLFVGKVE